MFKSQTFFLKCISARFDQSFADAIVVDATAISTPLDNVPLKIVQFGKVQIILLKSSQAVTNSARFNLGTPKR